MAKKLTIVLAIDLRLIRALGVGSNDREHLGQDELEVSPGEMEIRPLVTMIKGVQRID